MSEIVLDLFDDGGPGPDALDPLEVCVGSALLIYAWLVRPNSR